MRRVTGAGYFTLETLRAFVDDMLNVGFDPGTAVNLRPSGSQLGQDALEVNSQHTTMRAVDQELEYPGDDL